MKAMTERTLRKLCKEHCWLGQVLSDMGKKFPGAMHPEDVVVSIVHAQDIPMILTARIVSGFYVRGVAGACVPELFLVMGSYPQKIYRYENGKFPNPVENVMGAHAIVFASIYQRCFNSPTRLVVQVVKAKLGTFNNLLKEMYLQGNNPSFFEE